MVETNNVNNREYDIPDNQDIRNQLKLKENQKLNWQLLVKHELSYYLKYESKW